MKVKDVLAIDRVIFNMTYDQFIEWREDDYMRYLIESSKDHIDFTDNKVLNLFNDGKYDKDGDSILATLRAVTRYIIVDIGNVLDHKSYTRDKNINNIIG